MTSLRLTRLALAALFATAVASAAGPDAAALEQGGDIAYRRALAAATTGGRRLNADPTLAARTRRIANRVIAAAPAIDAEARHLPWAVNVVTDPALSVLVYPGGRILVNDALVGRSGLADEEIAAVVADAVAHSLLGHDAARIAAQAGAAAEAADPNRRALAVADVADAAVRTPRYTADEIAAADRAMVEMLARSAYDPRAAGSAWRRLRGTNGIGERIPISDERLAALDAAARAAVPLFEETRARAAAEAPTLRPPLGGAQRSVPR
jgi:predicted Zn-dependent protease